MAENPAGNDDFSWSDFDPEAYVAHYYSDPHPDDDEVVRMTCRALVQMRDRGEVVDVGTGPNLFPLLAALPRAQSVTAYEYSQANVDWLTKELQRTSLRDPWPHFWNIVCDTHQLKDRADPAARLATASRVIQGSIFELPERSWDAATMFFCAESITEKQEEFERACHAFARAVRASGILAAAFLAGSKGYVVAETAFPALAIDEASLRAAFADVATDIVITPIGLVEEEVRSGYSGMLFLTARAA
ncbi:MAG: hypothetical protein ABW199_00655 [Caulobacterales bacterium]